LNFSHFAPPVCTYRRHIFNYRCEIIRGFGNRVEFQEKVVETKQQIESPNPQAFAPKIVPCAVDVPPNNMGSSYITVVQPACIKKVGDIFYVTFAGRCEYDNTDIS